MIANTRQELPILGTLPYEWRITELGSSLDGGTRNGIYKPKEFHGSGDKIVNMGELFAHPRLFAVPMKRVELSEEERKRFSLQVGDLLFARRSVVAEGAGKCSVVCEVNEPTTFESSIIRARPNPNIANSMYLYYLFCSPFGAYSLDTILRQVAVAGITGKDLMKLIIPLPPIRTQFAIANILGTLDDKIELNRQMNQTLEAIARTIFNPWFVNFDPVRAKMEGRQPYGMDAKTAALFPNSFEDSPLGKIPEGWEIKSIESICSIVSRGVTPKYQEGSGRFIINQRVNRGSMLDWNSLKELSPDVIVPPEKFAARYDVLVNCLGEGTLGRVHIYVGESGKYAVDQHMSICRANTPNIAFYLYHILSGEEGQHQIEQLKTGSTGMTMFNISRLRSFPVLMPSEELVNSYGLIVLPLWERANNNEEENRTLATLRDTLLPKLLSGEIRVKEAENLVEEAV